jgi:hypothetical protein
MPRSEWDPSKLPAILKCMTLAVFRKNKGRESKRFADALLAARSTLVKIKYATGGSKDGPLSQFQLTAAGVRKNKDHLQDRAKHLQFDKLFKRYRAFIEIDEKRDEGEELKGDEEKDQAGT